MIPQLQAREKLTGAIVASYPHLTERARQQTHKAWMQEAGVEIVALKRKVGWGQLKDYLHGKTPGTMVKMVDGVEVEGEE